MQKPPVLKRVITFVVALLFATSANAAGISYPPGGVGDPTPHPNYVVSHWYTPYGPPITTAGGVAVTLNSARCFPGSVLRKLTITNLGVRITTVSAGGNIQAAIYNSTTSGRPGTLIGATGSMSTGTAGIVSAALSANKQVGPEGADGGANIWFCTNSDNSTVILVSNESNGNTVQALIGSATALNVLAGSTAVNGVFCAKTFGTWDDFSACTWTDITNRSAPMIIFQVNSVP